jgi:hypothetical protein
VLLMGLGADVSPVHGRAELLGVWRLFHEAGQAGGPLLTSAVVAASSVGPAVLVMGGLAARWKRRGRRPTESLVVAAGVRVM